MSKLLQNELNNTYRSLLRGMGVWDKKFFKDFFPGLLKHKTGIMSKLSLEEKKRGKKISERNSHFLAKENFAKLPGKVEKRCFSLVGEITDADYICMDEVDIAKPSAKLMEGIYKIHDSSRKEVVSGFLFHGVSIRGIPVIMQQEDIENNFKSSYFGEIINRLLRYTKKQGTLLLDAGYDYKSYIDFLQKKDVNFIVRTKRERWLYNKHGEKCSKMKSMGEGIHEVYLKQDNGSLTQVYFYVQQFEEFKDPMRMYSNRKDRDILEYKNRWEIENIFKTMKQEYKMESIRAGSLRVLNNIVATIQMAVAFATKLYGMQHERKKGSSKYFFQCDKFLIKKFEFFHWREGGNMNPNMYIRFLAEYIGKTFYSPPKKTTKKTHQYPSQRNSSTKTLLYETSAKNWGNLSYSVFQSSIFFYDRNKYISS